MGSLVQPRRPFKRRAAEEIYSSGKVVLEIDLNNFPDEIYEISHVLHGPSNTTASWQPLSIIPVETANEPANMPIYVDDNDDSVVILSESNQANQNGMQVNRTGMASVGNQSIDVIHIDSDAYSIYPGAIMEETATTLTLSNPHVGRIIPGTHVFSSTSYEDLESSHQSKRKRGGSSAELQMELFLEPEEPAQHGFKCVVCLGPMVDETSTICGHIFCQDCIKTAIKAQKKCPTCRKKLNMRNIHRVYFPGSV